MGYDERISEVSSHARRRRRAWSPLGRVELVGKVLQHANGDGASALLQRGLGGNAFGQVRSAGGFAIYELHFAAGQRGELHLDAGRAADEVTDAGGERAERLAAEQHLDPCPGQILIVAVDNGEPGPLEQHLHFRLHRGVDLRRRGPRRCGVGLGNAHGNLRELRALSRSTRRGDRVGRIFTGDEARAGTANLLDHLRRELVDGLTQVASGGRLDEHRFDQARLRADHLGRQVQLLVERERAAGDQQPGADEPAKLRRVLRVDQARLVELQLR